MCVCRLETEMRQLHQVIAQLRQARKNTKESADSALADRSSQQELIEKQQAELLQLRGAVREHQACEAENASLRDEASGWNGQTLHVVMREYAPCVHVHVCTCAANVKVLRSELME